jgi:hypothetical protein
MGALTTVDAGLGRGAAAANPEVSLRSQPTSALPRLPDRRYSKTPEVVRVQRHLLHDDLVDVNDEYKTWTSAHVVIDYIDLTTKKRTLRIRYENGDEEDVCKGVVDRPERRKIVRKKPSCTIDRGTSTVGSLAQHVRRNHSLPPPFDGHSSSTDDSSTSGSSAYVQQSSESTDEEKGVNSEETISEAIPARRWPRQLYVLQTQTAPTTSDSESTEWEADYQRNVKSRGGKAQSRGTALPCGEGVQALATGRGDEGGWAGGARFAERSIGGLPTKPGNAQCIGRSGQPNGHFPGEDHGGGQATSESSDSWYHPPPKR